MGDEARPLDRKPETLRCLVAPGGKVLRPLQRIERAVDLDGAKGIGGEGQLVLLAQAFGIEHPAPSLVPPAGNADPDVAVPHCDPNTRAILMRSIAGRAWPSTPKSSLTNSRRCWANMM